MRLLRLREINLKWKLKTFYFKWKGKMENINTSQKDSINSFLILYPGICLTENLAVSICSKLEKGTSEITFSYSVLLIFSWVVWEMFSLGSCGSFTNHMQEVKRCMTFSDKIPKHSTNTAGKFRLSSLHIKSEMLLTCRRRS